jgi:hypothetical protein
MNHNNNEGDGEGDAGDDHDIFSRVAHDMVTEIYSSVLERIDASRMHEEVELNDNDIIRTETISEQDEGDVNVEEGLVVEVKDDVPDTAPQEASAVIEDKVIDTTVPDEIHEHEQDNQELIGDTNTRVEEEEEAHTEEQDQEGEGVKDELSQEGTSENEEITAPIEHENVSNVGDDHIAVDEDIRSIDHTEDGQPTKQDNQEQDDLEAMFSEQLGGLGTYNDDHSEYGTWSEPATSPRSPSRLGSKPKRKKTRTNPKEHEEQHQKESFRNNRQKAVEAQRKYTLITQILRQHNRQQQHKGEASVETTATTAPSASVSAAASIPVPETELHRAKQELERLRLWHKEEALRRKRQLEIERKRQEAEMLEKQALERQRAESEAEKLRQRQQMLEFRRLKRAEEIESRERRKAQIQIENQLVLRAVPKTPLYHIVAQKYRESRLRKKAKASTMYKAKRTADTRAKGEHSSLVGSAEQQQQEQQHGDGHLSTFQEIPSKQTDIYKGKTMEYVIEQERKQQHAIMKQLEEAKAKLNKQRQYDALVKEMFAPVVDVHKRQEVELRRSKPPERHASQNKADKKTLPPEARGSKRKLPDQSHIKESSMSQQTPAGMGSKTVTSRPISMDPTLQFGNIRIIKSAKQVEAEREANIAHWQGRAKAILDSISEREAAFKGGTTLNQLERRVAKLSMVSAMYIDAVQAKLDLLAELCGVVIPL